jgi:preprotein translocase subunit YajC
MSSPQGQQGGSLLSFFTMMAVIFAIFYFLLIAPARKKQRQHAEMLRSLKNGDRVITTGGVFGTVVGVTDQVVQLRIADQVKIEVAKNAVADLVTTER